ncbi:MAG: hypothetical protein AAF999_13140 [Pseudomonadota bacterium]
MLIFADARLTYLATPKTGSTAVEMALRPKADIVLAKKRKHMNAARYRKKMAPFLKDTFGIRAETVAVMRAPVDQIRSWYRYRSRDEISGQPRSTRAMTFDAFVLAVAQEAPPEYAQIGSQFRFLTNRKGRLLVDHLFAYEAQDAFLDFMRARLKTEIELKRRNASPRREANLSDDSLMILRKARADEFALYERLMASGGYLGPG